MNTKIKIAWPFNEKRQNGTKIKKKKTDFWREKKPYVQLDTVRLVNINIFKRNTKLWEKKKFEMVVLCIFFKNICLFGMP